MKKWVIIAILLLVALGFGIWFWSLGSLPAEDPKTITLFVDQTTVEVREPDASEWKEATDGMTIGVGWRVRTGSRGRATIRFFDAGESRVDANSELTIAEGMVDETDPTKVAIRIKLDFGRIWSRVLKLFDLDSSYSIETSSVVATVRGTAFDVTVESGGATGVLVSESAIDVAPTDGIFLNGPASVAEGFRSDFDASGELIDRREFTDDARQSTWFRQNSSADIAYVAAEKERRRQALARLGGARPDSVFVGITQLSERMHLAVASDTNQNRIAQQYLARKFARLIELVESGKAGLAAQEFARLENHVRANLQGAAGAEERRQMKGALARISILVEDADPDSSLFPFKQRIENLREALSEGDETGTLYVRLLALDARLDEANRFMTRQDFRSAEMSVEVAENGIKNVEREAESILTSLSKEHRRGLRGKIDAIKARAEAVRGALNRAELPAQETATSTHDRMSTSTRNGLLEIEPPGTETPTIPPESTTPTTIVIPPVATPLYNAITISIQPNPVNIGAPANIIVEGIRRDGGSNDNLSARATYMIVSGSGNLNGPTVIGQAAGTITVRANFDDVGTILTSTASVSVQGAPELERLQLSSGQGATISGTAPTQIFANAHYTNGFSKNVTTFTDLTILTPSAGSMNGTLFQPDPTFQGIVEIQGTFSEDGDTVIGTIILTVQ